MKSHPPDLRSGLLSSGAALAVPAGTGARAKPFRRIECVITLETGSRDRAANMHAFAAAALTLLAESLV